VRLSRFPSGRPRGLALGRRVQPVEHRDLHGRQAFLRFAVGKRLAPPQSSCDVVRAGLRLTIGKRKYRSQRIDLRLALIVPYVNNHSLPPRVRALWRSST
jgi:hypothetical protein